MTSRPIGLLTTATLVAVVFAGCTANTGGNGDPLIYGTNTGGTISPGLINQAGSSTVEPLAADWAEQFGLARGVQIAVAGGGSGAGASGLCAKELDLADMSRKIKDSEVETCRGNGVEPVEWIVAFDGLSVVVSNKNTFVDALRVEQLKQIFIGEGHATHWDDVDSSYPHEQIRLCYPDNDSGTYEYFNEEILGDEAFETTGPRTGSGVQQSPDDNILVQCLKDDAYAIGYFGYAYYVENTDKVNLVAVDGVKPSPKTVAGGQYTPLSRPLHIYTDGVPTGILADYIAYVLNPHGGQARIPGVGYVPLDPETRGTMLAQLGQ